MSDTHGCEPSEPVDVVECGTSNIVKLTRTMAPVLMIGGASASSPLLASYYQVRETLPILENLPRYSHSTTMHTIFGITQAYLR